MKFKFISFSLFLFAGLFLLSSCGKEDIVTTETNTGGVNPVTVTCDLEGAIEESPAGTFTVNLEGGTEPYAYMWTNEATTASITLNEAGTFGVMVTDAEGCTLELTGSFDGGGGNGDCDGFGVELEQGGTQVWAYAYGGNEPYTFTASTGETATGVTEFQVDTNGAQVTITVEDANGCITSATSMEVDPCTTLGVFLVESSAGTLTAYISGGTQPYEALSSNGDVAQGNFNEFSMPIAAGETITVNVTDADGCTASATYTGTDPCQSFEASIFDQANGELYVQTFGGTAPYSHVWSTGGTGNIITVTAAGTYSVTSTDAQGCEVVSSVTVNDPDPCANLGIEWWVENGMLMTQIYGGTAPYTYEWSTGETTNSIAVTIPGVYTVTVIDANGCIVTQVIEL